MVGDMCSHSRIPKTLQFPQTATVLGVVPSTCQVSALLSVCLAMIITPLSHVSKGRASQFFSECCAAESWELKAAEATAQEFTGSMRKDWC